MMIKLKIIIPFMTLALIFSLVLACGEGSSSIQSGEKRAIEAVKDDLTTDIVGSWVCC